MATFAVLFAVATGALFLAPTRLQETVAPPATFFASPAGESDGQDHEFVAALQPKLDTLVGEGMALKQLGEYRSRNILQLTVRMDRFRSAADAINVYLNTVDIPAIYSEPVARLRSEIGLAEAAIDASIAAIKGFDWDQLGVEVELFGKAVDALGLIATEIVEMQ